MKILKLQLARGFEYEIEHYRILFHNGTVPCTTRHQLEAYASSSSKQIQGFQRRYVHIINKYVKQALFRNICSRPGVRHFSRRFYFSTTQLPAYYTHNDILRSGEK